MNTLSAMLTPFANINCLHLNLIFAQFNTGHWEMGVTKHWVLEATEHSTLGDTEQWGSSEKLGPLETLSTGGHWTLSNRGPVCNWGHWTLDTLHWGPLNTEHWGPLDIERWGPLDTERCINNNSNLSWYLFFTLIGWRKMSRILYLEKIIFISGFPSHRPTRTLTLGHFCGCNFIF